MTQIAILNGDFEVLMDDETVGGNAVAGLKLIRRAVGASTTVYTTNALYSAVAEVMDDFIAMGFENSMLPVTPNAYTMENDFFMPRSSTEFLKEGAITADWTVSGTAGIYSKEYVDSTPFVFADIGRQVLEATSGDAGTLLDFEVLPNGNLLAWIRPDTAGDTFALSTAISVVADGGTGVSASSTAATNGQSTYSSIQAIGSVPTATEVYLVQERFKMTDAAGAFQWWATDPTLSLGIIDILIRVERDDTAIADGDVEVMARRYTSLYDNFRLNVSAGGRSALPLASAPDINNTTGYFSGSWVSGTGSAMVVGDIQSNTFSGKLLGKYVVTAATDGGATGDFEWYEVGDLTPFANSDTFTGTNRNGTISGAPVANLTGPTDGTAGEGGTVTITLGTTTFDHDGVGGPEPYSATVDAQSDVIAAKVYERMKYVTRRGGNAADLFGAGVNVDGEQYRGLEAQAQYNTPSGTFNEGDDVDVVATGFTARVISVNVTDTYVMLTDQQTSVTPLASADVLRDESTDTVTIDSSPSFFTSPKSSPFCTFTGTVIFGARGILFINPASTDTQNYNLIDDNGTIRTPPNTISFVVTNTAAGDRVLVARDTGTAGIINKDQFGGMETSAGVYNDLDDSVIRVAGSVDTEVPASGYVRVLENALQQEHHYVYDSRSTGAAGEFNLRVVNSGTDITSASTTQLIDTTATFQSAPLVEVGMLVRNTFAGKTTHVWEVTNVVNTTTLDVVPLYGPGGASQDWDLNDTYSINKLIGDHTAPAGYANTDDLYDLILDREATGTDVSNSLVKLLASDFDVVVNVRQGKVILPFTQNQTQGDGNTSVTVVRTPDTIAV